MGTSRYWKPTACTDLDTSSLPGTHGYFKVLKANSMYRPWYQFTTGYTWVLQGSESQQHVQTSIPVHYQVHMGTSRYWKPTACTDLDTSSLPGTHGYFKVLKTACTDLDASALEDWTYAVGHQEQVASLGWHEGQILSSQLQGRKKTKTSRLQSRSFSFWKKQQKPDKYKTVRTQSKTSSITCGKEKDYKS